MNTAGADKVNKPSNFVQSISRIFSDGDMESARKLILHSGVWQQGLFSAYGQSQQSRLWVNWLGKCGLSAVEHCETLSYGGSKIAFLCELRPEKSQSTVRILFCISHNESHIKQVNMLTDTNLLAQALDTSTDDIKAWWPNPDPLVICDYDHQIHLETFHAKPSDMLSGYQGHSHSQLLNQWWEIWQRMQFSHINALYAENAQVFLPGKAEAQNSSALFSYCSTLIMGLERHYCQLTDIIIDSDCNTKMLVNWYLEGDYRPSNSSAGSVQMQSRVRMCFSSILQIKDNKIQSEVLLFDQCAFQKQFPACHLAM
jgi:hypothetical protein